VSIRLSPVCFYNKDTPFCWIFQVLILQGRANGLRYLRWGGDGEAVQPEKC